MKKLYIFIIALLSVMAVNLAPTPLYADASIYSRGNTFNEQSLCPTPEASSVLKYTDIPFDYVTGAFTMNIPLYTLQGTYLSIPIALSYYSGGIKLDEIAGVAGLGWSLSAGGCITRTVMDMPDEISAVQMYHELPDENLLNQLENRENSTRTNKYLRDIYGHYVDAMLDMYSYNVCGLSGQFVIDDNGDVFQLSGDGVKITYRRNQDNRQIESFTVVGPDGTRYVFSEKEIATHFSTNGISLNVREQWSACTAWYVSSITSANKSETVRFTYKDGYPWIQRKFTERQTKTVKRAAISGTGTGNLHTYTDTVNDMYNGDPIADNMTTTPVPNTTISNSRGNMYEETATKLVSSITLNGDTVTFSYDECAESHPNHLGTEGYNYPAMLKTLTVKNYLNRTLKSYAFSTERDSKDGRVVLNGISQKDSSGREDDYWEFKYNTLAKVVSHYEQDWYGYYNGVHNGSGVGLCPYTYKMVSFNQPSIYGIPDGAKANYMSMKSAIHNGACTEIEYEGSMYRQSGDESIGVRVKELRVKDLSEGNGRLYRKRLFSYESPEPSGVSYPGRDLYTTSSASGDPAGDMTWNFTLSEDPVIFGPSIRETRIYYGKVGETVVDDSANSYGKTVRTFDTSRIWRGWYNVYNSCPSSVIDAFKEYGKTNNAFGEDPYVGICHSYMQSGPGEEAPLIKIEEYASGEDGIETKVSEEEYTYSTPVKESVMVAYYANQTWSKSGTFNFESMFHFPIYAQSYSGRVPLKKMETRYHTNGKTTKTVDYTYKERGSNFESPFRLSSEVHKGDKRRQRLEYKYADDLLEDTELSSGSSALYIAHVLTPALRTVYAIENEGRTYPGHAGGVTINPFNPRGSLNDLNHLGNIPRKSSSAVTGPTTSYYEVFKKQLDVSYDPNWLLPKTRKEYTDSTLSWTEEVVARDGKGNITDIRQRGKPETVLVWGYGGRYPVAVIENSTISAVSALLSGVGAPALLSMSTPELSETQIEALNSLREMLPDALVRTYEYRAGVGMTKLTDENGISTLFDYDASGRLLSVKDAQGNPVEEYEYKLLMEKNNPTPLGIRTKSYTSENGESYRENVGWWNGLGLKVEDIAIGASGTRKDLVTAYSPDRLFHDDAKVWLPYPVNNTAGAYQTSATARSAEYHSSDLAYTSKNYEKSRLDKVLTTAQPGFSGLYECRYETGSAVSLPKYLWSEGKIVDKGKYADSLAVQESVINEDGIQTHTFKDVDGRLLARSIGADSLTYYVYDNKDRLRAIVGSEIAVSDTINMWRFDYDALGRMSAKGAPGCAKEFYIYDDNDRLIEVQRPNDTVENEYDALGRVTKVNLKASGYAERSLIEENRYSGGFKIWSRLAEFEANQTVNNYATVAYQYDDKGRLSRSETQYSDGSVLTEEYSYTFDGLLLQKTSRHSQAAVTDVELSQSYTYDNMGRVKRSTNTLYENGAVKQQVALAHTYDELGRLSETESKEFNGQFRCLDANYAYNLQNRLSGKTSTRINPQVDPGLSISKTELKDSLHYSPGGLVSRIEESGSLGQGIKEYSYDYAGRLVQDMSKGVMTQYVYDARGNILYDGSKTYTYEGDMLKECQTVGETMTFTHDSMGRMTVDGYSGTQIEYNSLNLPSKIVKSGTSEVNYSYLANGDKLSSLKEDGSGLVYRGPFVYRRNSDGALSFESAEYEGGRLEPNASYYYMTDHLGSTRAVARTDIYKVGDVVDYSSYGEKTQVSGTSLTRTYFTGKEDQSIDFALPYTDFGARHYSPSLHRWLTPDPRGLDNPTVSGYSYCNNDPINHIDLDGEFPLLTNLIGGVASALVDYSGQVLANFVGGEKGLSAFTKVDVADLGVSFAEGFVTSGGNIVKKALTKTAVIVASEVTRNAIDLTVNDNNTLTVEFKSASETTVDTAIGLTVGSITTGIKAKPFKLQSANQAVSTERFVRHAKGQGLSASEAKTIATKTRADNEVKKAANEVIENNVNSVVGNSLGAKVKALFKKKINE